MRRTPFQHVGPNLSLVRRIEDELEETDAMDRLKDDQMTRQWEEVSEEDEELCREMVETVLGYVQV